MAKPLRYLKCLLFMRFPPIVGRLIPSFLWKLNQPGVPRGVNQKIGSPLRVAPNFQIDRTLALTPVAGSGAFSTRTQ